jgi:hypothetical protein
MDPDTLKALQTIGEVVGPFAAAPTVKELILKMLGPTADYFGVRLKKCFDRSDQMIEDAKATATYPPPKLLLPLAQAAMLEESEVLHEMFAALLANARIPKGPEVRPAFIGIVSQLAPDEAVLLNEIRIQSNEYQSWQMGVGTLPLAKRQLAIDERNREHVRRLIESLPVLANESEEERSSRMRTCARILDGLGLVAHVNFIPIMTGLGITLLNACTPPTPKTDG